ncbi:hypothetical protein [Brevundimonas sp.]|uniref:hypothetical protein n=1 Tax=Brevundimonas sp. TaxID=1871086 RepID=UPI002D2BF1BB|nr:hypothetical protein [Brevundimonas sp.]HYC68657.1 hypothetical protein [Brevundimonas sp.]
MKRALSTGFLVIYWVALPFAALIMIGLGWLMLAPSASQSASLVVPLWVSFAASIILTLLIVWRLWTHERARRSAREHASSSNEASRTNDD